MPVPPEEFKAYLAPGESVVQWAPGRFVDGAYRSNGVVGVTDRRLVFVADGDRFVDVAPDSVCAIRCTIRSSRTTAGIGYPLLAVVGVLVTVLGLVGVVGIQPTTPVTALALTTVGGAVAAEGLRRSGVSVNGEAIDAVRRAWRGEADSRLRELAGVKPVRRGGGDGLVVATGLVSLFGLVGLVVVTGTLIAVPLALTSLAGFALADVAYRRWERLAARGGSRRQERAISVDLVNGRTVDLRVDAADRVDRALSEVVREPIRREAPGGAMPSTAESAGNQR